MRRITAATASANATPTTPGATSATSFRARSPAHTANRNPASGSAGISHSVADGTTEASLIGSPAEHRQLVGVDGRAVPERRDDDGEADGRLRGGDRHHEEDDHLSFDRAELAGERDEGQV